MPGICLHLHLQPLDAINFPLRLTKGAQKTTLVDPSQDVLKHNKPVVCYENSRWTLQGVFFFRFETVLDPFSINKKAPHFQSKSIYIYILSYIVIHAFFPIQLDMDFHAFSKSQFSHHCHPATLLACADASTKTGSIWCWMFLQQGDRIAPVALT